MYLTLKKKLVDNGALILPDFAIFILLNIKLGKTQITYIYGLTKTTLEPKNHDSNSKNKRFVI